MYVYRRVLREERILMKLEGKVTEFQGHYTATISPVLPNGKASHAIRVKSFRNQQNAQEWIEGEISDLRYLAQGRSETVVMREEYEI